MTGEVSGARDCAVLDRSDWLELAGTPVAYGGHAWIFSHPRDLGKLVKVARPPRELGTRWSFKARRKFVENHRYQRRAFLDCRARGYCPPVAEVFGTVRTSFGPGVVVEGILGEDGDLGPNLASLIEQRRIDRERWGAVHDLMNLALECGVVIPDLQPENIVWGTARGRTGFFIVDGFESHTLVRNFGWNRTLDMRRMRFSWREQILAPLAICPTPSRKALARAVENRL